MQNVFVIGCNGEIGKAICGSLKEENYYVLGSDKEYSLNGNVDEFFNCDLNISEDILKLCDKIKTKGELWGVIFSAGIYPIVELNDYTIELWERVININLKSSFLIVRELYLQMQNGSRIIFISSGASYLGSNDIGYSVSKSGIQGLARSLAKQFEGRILVNTISPGLIETQMSNSMVYERRNETIKGTLLKRAGQPNELIKAVTFLLDSKNSYMTAATIDINGGLYSR